MGNKSLKDIESISSIEEVDGRYLRISISPNTLEQMIWSLESINNKILVYPATSKGSYYFEILHSKDFTGVEDIRTNEFIALVTKGDIRNVNTETKVDFGNENILGPEEVVIMKKLIDFLIERFMHFFGPKPHWVQSDDFQFVKIISDKEFKVLETTDLRKVSDENNNFAVTAMGINLNDYNITDESFFKKYLKAYGYKSLKKLKFQYAVANKTDINQIIAEIISKTDSFNNADARHYCKTEKEVMEFISEYIKKH